ncbi:TetR/AcrR family transcriptional regulator [Caulobacter soli]|uniref:TetR/AcrR family transcriptional regulator n=1 Tax=Caulobacter soli TaxID=2708539 RepID=UPI0013EDE5BF|nr:TetR/AcrR family transcriptional regulator [Caulobacter soli]
MTRRTTTDGQTDRYELKREALVEAAARLFNEKGLRGATLSDVGQAVGLITQSVTYYYKRKEDLAAACLMRSTEAFAPPLARAAAEATPERRLRAFLTGYFELLADIAAGRRAELINFYDMRALTGPQAQAVNAAFNELFRALRALLRPISGPAFERREENARTHLVLSTVLWARTWAARYQPEDYPRAAERMADVLIEGFAKTALSWPPAPLQGFDALVYDPAAVSREAFLRVATEMINAEGFQGASVDKISARLNVTKGSFYHHNETKDDLVAECFDRSFQIVHDAQRASVTTGASLMDRLAAEGDALVRRQLSDHGPLLRYMALAASPPASRQNLMVTMARQTAHFAGQITDGMIDGSVRPVDPAIAAEILTAMINGAADLPLWAPGITPDEASSAYAKPLFTGVLN